MRGTTSPTIRPGPAPITGARMVSPGSATITSGCALRCPVERQDPILKERLFGLTNSEGNHGEDVKEYYFYLDSTPTHSYMKYLYKYPQAAFPYNRSRRIRDATRPTWNSSCSIPASSTKTAISMSSWNMRRLAKRSPDPDQRRNRGPEPAARHVLPTLWFRNTWTWTPTQTVIEAGRQPKRQSRFGLTCRAGSAVSGLRGK